MAASVHGPNAASSPDDHAARDRQVILHGHLYERGRDAPILMAVDGARPRHLFPRDGRMASFECVGETTRRFRDDLEASNDRAEGAETITERFVCEVCRKALGQLDGIQDVVLPAAQ